MFNYVHLLNVSVTHESLVELRNDYAQQHTPLQLICVFRLRSPENAGLTIQNRKSRIEN